MTFLSAILPIKEAFKAGTLMMPTVAGAVGEATVLQWGDFTLNRIFCCACAIAAALSINSLFRLLPALNDCFLLGKGFQQVENSPQLERSRNSLAFLSVLMVLIPLSRYQILNPATLEIFPEPVRLAGTATLVVLYLLLRFISYRAFKPGRRRIDNYRLARKSAWSFMIIVASVMIFTSVLFWICRLPDSAARVTLIVEAAVLYFLYLVRKGQIFLSACGPFTTFLYLCALEFLPTGLFVAIVLSI